jgi:hypothetical protein
VIRSYADTVLSGHSDTDLTPRQRRYCGILLNTASNAAYAFYPPSDADREAAVKRIHDLVWDAGALFTNAERADLGTACERATASLRGM